MYLGEGNFTHKYGLDLTYKLMGFEEIRQEGNWSLLKYSGAEKEYPDYLEVEVIE